MYTTSASTNCPVTPQIECKPCTSWPKAAREIKDTNLASPVLQIVLTKTLQRHHHRNSRQFHLNRMFKIANVFTDKSKIIATTTAFLHPFYNFISREQWKKKCWHRGSLILFCSCFESSCYNIVNKTSRY